MTLKLENKLWWEYIGEDLQELLLTSKALVEKVSLLGENFDDYSFVVFPAAKAYEGFLKRMFLDMGLMREDEYYGDEIRIGRILNPNYMRDRGNVFDRLCGLEVSKTLWDSWKRGRNQVFHFFPHNFRRLSYDEAITIINDLISAMNSAVTGCKLK